MIPDLLVIANPNAGRFSDDLLDRARRVVAATADVEVVVTSTPAEVAPVLDRLGDRWPVILGGDGTNNVVVGALAERGQLDRPVGLVPAGTADAFARGVGLPRDAEAAAARVVSGRHRPLDLIEGSDGRVAVNDVHTGVGSANPTAIRRVKPFLRSRTYPVVNAVAALLTPGWPVRVEVDGRTIAGGGPVLAVAVGNGPVLGDGTPLWPDADPDDGWLDVVVLPARARWERPALARAVLAGRHGGRDDVATARGREVRIVGGPGAHNADGEQWSGVDDVTYRVRPGAWRLCC